jgi:hypothetical protein
MQTIDRKQSHASSGGALLAGAAFLVALAVVAPGEAFAGCGSGGASTGAHPASSGGGGTHSGASAPAGSSGGGASSCGGNALSTRGALTPSLAGVHTGVFTGNGTRKTGALSRTAKTVTAARTVASTARTVQTAGGTAHASFVRPGRHR